MTRGHFSLCLSTSLLLFLIHWQHIGTYVLMFRVSSFNRTPLPTEMVLLHLTGLTPLAEMVFCMRGHWFGYLFTEHTSCSVASKCRARSHHRQWNPVNVSSHTFSSLMVLSSNSGWVSHLSVVTERSLPGLKGLFNSDSQYFSHFLCRGWGRWGRGVMLTHDKSFVALCM